MNKHRRELKNLIVNKRFQARFTYYFVSLSLALLGLMMLFMNSHINDLRVLLANVSGLPMAPQLAIEDALNQLFVTAFAFLLLALAGAVAYGIVVSHRIAGPMVAILKYIESLKTGQYEDTRRLRPNDELAPIMESLHQLAQDLQTRAK